MGMYDDTSLDGTLIGADGQRYDAEDENRPTTAQPAPGRGVTQERLNDALNSLYQFLSAHEITVTTVNADATVTVTSGTVSDLDKGAPVAGPGIPDAATILSVTDSTHFELSVNASSAGTGRVLALTPPLSLVLKNLGDIVNAL